MDSDHRLWFTKVGEPECHCYFRDLSIVFKSVLFLCILLSSWIRYVMIWYDIMWCHVVEINLMINDVIRENKEKYAALYHQRENLWTTSSAHKVCKGRRGWLFSMTYLKQPRGSGTAPKQKGECMRGKSILSSGHWSRKTWRAVSLRSGRVP